MAENKIMMGLENVHWFELTETEVEGVISTTYGTAHRWPGAVNLSVDPQGDSDPFYADNGIYFMSGENVGYAGNLETAVIPEELKEYALGRVTDDKGVSIETSQGPKKAFAITADLTGDAKARRVVFYKVFMGRPTIAAGTKTNSNTPQTETAPLTCVPRTDYVKVYRDGEEREERLVHAATKAGTNAAAYSAWHTAPYVPEVTAPQG